MSLSSHIDSLLAYFLKAYPSHSPARLALQESLVSPEERPARRTAVQEQLRLLQEQVKVETQVTDLEVAHFLNQDLITLLSAVDGHLEL